MNSNVSIVIPAYNRAHKIEEAVKSIQGQTYSHWEIIISDDGSKDNTKEVVAKLMASDKRIRFVSNDTNRGAQAARNAGIKAAQGEWIAFLDSDDQWLPESLELRLKMAEKENVSVVHSDAYIIHEGEEMKRYYLPALKGKVYKNILSKEGPMFQALLVKSDALKRIGYLDEQIRAYQEWDTSIRLSKYFPFAFVPVPTFIYDYRTPDAISRDSLRNAKAYKHIVKKHLFAMFFHGGISSMGEHYQKISSWYQSGGDQTSSKHYKILSIICKCLSPIVVLRKIKHLVTRKG